MASNLHGYLDLDETRPEAAEALVMQAHADVVETLAHCADDTDADGKRLKALLMTLPPYFDSADID